MASEVSHQSSAPFVAALWADTVPAIERLRNAIYLPKVNREVMAFKMLEELARQHDVGALGRVLSGALSPSDLTSLILWVVSSVFVPLSLRSFLEGAETESPLRGIRVREYKYSYTKLS